MVSWSCRHVLHALKQPHMFWQPAYPALHCFWWSTSMARWQCWRSCMHRFWYRGDSPHDESSLWMVWLATQSPPCHLGKVEQKTIPASGPIDVLRTVSPVDTMADFVPDPSSTDNNAATHLIKHNGNQKYSSIWSKLANHESNLEDGILAPSPFQPKVRCFSNYMCTIVSSEIKVLTKEKT